MSSEAEKLLKRMRRSKAGWTRRDLDALYLGFGFVIRPGGKHDVVKHPDYPHLRTTLSRGSALAKGYISFAIKLIDDLNLLMKHKGGT